MENKINKIKQTNLNNLKTNNNLSFKFIAQENNSYEFWPVDSIKKNANFSGQL